MEEKAEARDVPEVEECLIEPFKHFVFFPKAKHHVLHFRPDEIAEFIEEDFWSCGL